MSFHGGRTVRCKFLIQLWRTSVRRCVKTTLRAEGDGEEDEEKETEIWNQIVMQSIDSLKQLLLKIENDS